MMAASGNRAAYDIACYVRVLSPLVLESDVVRPSNRRPTIFNLLL